MDWPNRVGLYGSCFFGVAGIGFTLRYLPLYLGHEGLSDRAIGLVSTLAAVAGLAQFPLAGVGVIATAIVVFLIPETLTRGRELHEHDLVDVRAAPSDLSVVV